MHQNTPNYDSNIHFGPPWSPGGGFWGSKSRFDPHRGFFAQNQKVQKTKFVFICPMNNTELVLAQNFEIGTLSPPLYLRSHEVSCDITKVQENQWECIKKWDASRIDKYQFKLKSVEEGSDLKLQFGNLIVWADLFTIGPICEAFQHIDVPIFRVELWRKEAGRQWRRRQ